MYVWRLTWSYQQSTSHGHRSTVCVCWPVPWHWYSTWESCWLITRTRRVITLLCLNYVMMLFKSYNGIIITSCPHWDLNEVKKIGSSPLPTPKTPSNPSPIPTPRSPWRPREMTNVLGITLGLYEAGIWAKHPSLMLPAGESPADTLAPAISRGCPSCLHWLLTWVACGAHPCRSCMVAPRDYFYDGKEASGILKIIKS